MPGPMSHYIFYRKLESKLRKRGVKVPDNYDQYSNFAQGHDLVLFQNYIKIVWNKMQGIGVDMCKKLQEYSFADFVYCYLKNAEDMGLLQDEGVRAFLCYGYVAHHMFDAYEHPLIIYFSGDHVKEKGMKRWNHGIAENLIDAYLVEKEYGRKAAKLPIHKFFRFKKDLFTGELENLVTKTVKTIYGYENAGRWFRDGCNMMYIYMRRLKYDPTGIRRVLLDFIEHFAHGANAYSYNRDLSQVGKYMNERKEKWVNPMLPDIESSASFMDLFDSALERTAEIIAKLQIVIDKGVIKKEEIRKIIPNIASTHGQECGKELDIKVTKKAC